MIKRPLAARFREPVLRGEKTTIRDKPWPVGVPIMLYHWSGAAYSSKHCDVAPVVVKGFWTIRITHTLDGTMGYECGRECGLPIYKTEGFLSQSEMDEWFSALVKRSQTVEKTLMRFCRLNVMVSGGTPSAAPGVGRLVNEAKKG